MLNFCVILFHFWEIVLRRKGMLLLKNRNPMLNVEIAVTAVLLFRRVIYS